MAMADETPAGGTPLHVCSPSSIQGDGPDLHSKPEANATHLSAADLVFADDLKSPTKRIRKPRQCQVDHAVKLRSRVNMAIQKHVLVLGSVFVHRTLTIRLTSINVELE